MKKIILLICMFVIKTSVTYSSEFEFTPININFSGVEIHNDIFYTYGTCGSMLMSADKMVNWKQVRIFQRGDIVKLFFSENKIIAFSSYGQIATSINNGIAWTINADLKEEIMAVIEYPGGYFLRTYYKVLTISEDFSKQKEYKLNSKKLVEDAFYNYKYTKSLAFFNNCLFAATDSAKFIRFDLHLNYLDIKSFEKSNLKDIGYNGNYQIDINSNEFYSEVGSVIYKTKDFITVEIVGKNTTVGFYKFIDAEIFIINYKNMINPKFSNFSYTLSRVVNSDSNEVMSYSENHYASSSLSITDFTILNNNWYIVGRNKLITATNLADTVLNIISDYSGYCSETIPDRLNDSTYIFYSGGYNGTYYNFIYKTTNSGITFKPIIDYRIVDKFRTYTFGIKYFDNEKKTLYLGGTYDQTSTDGMYKIDFNTDKVEFIKIPWFSFNTHNIYKEIQTLPNIQKVGNTFVMPCNSKYNLVYSKIFKYTEDFELISRYTDSNYVIDYIHCRDESKILIHCLNLIDKTTEIRYTEDDCKNWTLLKKYPVEDNNLYYKEINVGNRNLLALFYYNLKDSNITIDMMDLETNSIKAIYKYKVIDKTFYAKLGNSIYSDGNVIYLSIRDTVFYTTDIYDKSKWKHFHFNNNGKIIRTITKFDDRFLVRYSDDLNPSKYVLYWMKIKSISVEKPIISVADIDFGKFDIEQQNYYKKTVKIENLSKTEDLLITSYTKPKGSVFSIDLAEISENVPLVIKPNNSYVFNVTFQPKEVGIFNDSIIFHSNALSLDSIAHFKGECIDTTSGFVEDFTIDKDNYLYSFPPFPNPATKEVRSLVYWDMSSDIEQDEIGVYNIFGAKLGDRSKISFDKLNLYSGYLIWNCAGMETGVYIIVIKHGTTTRSIKVMVN
jgi:hypothetical protein